MTKQNLILTSLISVVIITGAGVLIANSMGYSFGSNYQNKEQVQKNNTSSQNDFNQNQQKQTNNASTQNNTDLPTNTVNTTNPVSTLTQAEQDMLLKMREEEKLARDVYLTLGQKFPSIGQILANIPKSEQKYTDTVKLVLDKYNLTDPITDDTVGVFKDQAFAKLYQDLVAKGSVSEIEALKVGATIEDLDISDLNSDLSQTTNPDIVSAFEKLRNGSYNHLRSFMNKITALGQTYTPQYISETEFQNILSSQNSGGNGQTGGNPSGNGQRRKI